MAYLLFLLYSKITIMKKLLALIVLLILVVNPIFSQTKEDKKAAKEATFLKEYEVMKAIVNAESYTFEGEWATTYKGRRINLISNPTFIKMDNKSADAFLPFFGRAFSGAGYGGTNGGIEFKGEVENYQVNFIDKKRKAIVKFKAKSKSSEIYDVSIIVNGNKTAIVNINSNNRTTMNYSGKIKKREKLED